MTVKVLFYVIFIHFINEQDLYLQGSDVKKIQQPEKFKKKAFTVIVSVIKTKRWS